jgi:hypothetical protein
MRTAGFIAGVVAILTLWSAGAVIAASHSSEVANVTADLDGHRIKSSLISRYYCHDFEYPRIRCFASAAALEASKAERASTLAAVSPNFGAGDYVTIFDGVSYTGAYMDVSQNYDALFSIGWNDRISSYKGRNSGSGTFWTDWYASGTGINFCCNTNVGNLASGLDNAFSSIYRH